jgi:hypothetical protein
VIDVLEELADDAIDAHTSIVLAYNVDLLVYDKLVRRRLAASGVTSQIVFCDAVPYAASLDGVDQHSRVGRAYSVTPVRVEGAFHPKVYLLLGRRRARLVVGSGNASLGGLVRNVEVFGRFDFDAEAGVGPHPAFREVFDLAKALGATALPAVRAQLARAEQWSPWLADVPAPDGRVVRVGGPGRTPLIDAIAERVRVDGVVRIVAMASSFDRRLEAVRALATLGGGAHETLVVVQPERVTLDGREVGALASAASWRTFRDPRPSKKREPRDSYLHAKLVLVETTKADHLFFGSANLSRPALLDGGNIELLIEVPPEAPGTWVERLGLAESLTDDAGPALRGLKWTERDDDPARPPISLVGVEWSPRDGWIVALSGRIDVDVTLAIGAARGRPDALLPVHRRADGAFVAVAGASETARFGWLVDRTGEPASNAVALTWPEVARMRVSGWLGGRVEQAILGMKQGELLGHVLFEFLDGVPDFGVLAVAQLRQGSRERERSEEDDAAEPDRTETSFYTDATAAVSPAVAFAAGDRSDLELLASLVQPLSTPSRAMHDEDADEEDDEGIAEEAERRNLDVSKTTDGSERTASTRVPTARRMRTAGRRFTRRVERAAQSLAETVDAVGDDLVIPPGLVARQVWMVFIAAFVAGRPVDTADEGEQVVVEPSVLAHFVLRCAAALAGDARGGLLRQLDPAAWATREGAALAEGLRFMVAVCAWATAWFESEYAEGDRAWTSGSVVAVGVHDAIPLFVFARFLAAVGVHVPDPDYDDAARRCSTWRVLPRERIADAHRRARRIATWFAGADAGTERALATKDIAPGSAILAGKFGAAMVLASRDGIASVALLGRPRSPIARFSLAKVRGVELPDVGRLLLASVPPESLGA